MFQAGLALFLHFCCTSGTELGVATLGGRELLLMLCWVPTSPMVNEVAAADPTLLPFSCSIPPDITIPLTPSFFIPSTGPAVMSSLVAQFTSHLDANLAQLSSLRFLSWLSCSLSFGPPEHFNISKWMWLWHVRNWPFVLPFNWLQAMLVCLHVL